MITLNLLLYATSFRPVRLQIRNTGLDLVDSALNASQGVAKLISNSIKLPRYQTYLGFWS